MLKILGLTLLIILSNSIRAEIITDGTLGHYIDLPGPNFQITADLGQQHGGNLFHSFQNFNLQSHESATFSGPNEVQNVISRVTGGNPSNIDGLIRSTIPNADVYFLNPYGIFFGPNAKLDVQGGFHASTADYLRLQDGGRFEARMPGNSVLTVAPVAAFGFLTNTPATITTQDGSISTSATQAGGGNILLNGLSGLLYLDNSEITTSVASGTGDGGNITVEKPQFVVMNHGNIIAQADAGNGGNIRIVADNFLKTPESLLSASSKLGIDGEIIIESLDEMFRDNLFSLSTTFIDASRLLPQPCGKMSFETEANRSKFIIHPLTGSTLSHHDFQPSPRFVGQ